MAVPQIALPGFPVEGGCVCGSVRYRLTAPPLSVYNCHCRDCQRITGASHAMSMPVRAEHFEAIAGVPAFCDRVAASGRVVRSFECAQCFCRIWNQPLSAPEIVIIKPGTLDDPGWAVPVADIWTQSRLPWVAVDPDRLNIAGQPPSRDLLYAAWQTLLAAEH